MNLIPKEGGNNFRGSFFATGANGSFQSNNYTAELKAAGLSTPNELQKIYDINPSFGGPIIKNKLWFFGSMRWQENSFYYAGAYANANGGDLTKWNYVPDLNHARAERSDREPERQPPPDLAGDAEKQDRLLGRSAEPALELGDRQCGARRICGLGVPARKLHDRHVVVAGDEQVPARRALGQPRRGLRRHVPDGFVQGCDPGQGPEHRVPVSRQGLLLHSVRLLRHAGRAAHHAGAGVGRVRHRRARHEVRLAERLRHVDRLPVRQLARALLPVLGRRHGCERAVADAGFARAARAAVLPDDAPLGGDGDLRAGQVDVQARHDQRRPPVRLLQEQLPRAATRADRLDADAQRHDSGGGLQQHEGHHAARRSGLRPVRQREDGAQAGVGQVHRGRRSHRGQPDFESVVHRPPQLDAEARHSVRRTTTRRSATCSTRPPTATAARRTTRSSVS